MVMVINRVIKKCLAISWVLFSLWSCGGGADEKPEEILAFIRPEHFPEPTYTFQNNPITEEGFELGKKLFFDPILSRDKSVSCNNCHQQSRAFADTPLHPTSVGVDNRFGIRNAPSIANMAFMKEFFWDGGVTHLDFVPINAIESDVEMDESLENVVKKLNAIEAYRTKFKTAFGTEEATAPYLLHALSQFTAMMISADSKYDKYLQGQEELTANESRGLALFEQKCSSCHAGVLFTDQSYRNNGISSDFGDKGRGLITEDEADEGKFKVPSLRNASITAPYMHNAKFSTLEEVLEHYANGMADSPTLDTSFKNREVVVGIPMTKEEQGDIIEFIHTLTDYTFISDERFRNNE